MGHGKVGKEKCCSPCIKEGVSNELVFDGPHNFTTTYFIPENKASNSVYKINYS